MKIKPRSAPDSLPMDTIMERIGDLRVRIPSIHTATKQLLTRIAVEMGYKRKLWGDGIIR